MVHGWGTFAVATACGFGWMLLQGALAYMRGYEESPWPRFSGRWWFRGIAWPLYAGGSIAFAAHQPLRFWVVGLFAIAVTSMVLLFSDASLVATRMLSPRGEPAEAVDARPSWWSWWTAPRVANLLTTLTLLATVLIAVLK